jgi:hypothetical protein
MRKVKVYKNLHASRKASMAIYSVQDSKTRLVTDRVSAAFLTDVTFKVSQKGRQRVIREGRKNVHAFVVGELFGVSSAAERLHNLLKSGSWGSTQGHNGRQWFSATYNPYKYETFVDRKTEKPIHQSDLVYIGAEGVFYLGKP